MLHLLLSRTGPDKDNGVIILIFDIGLLTALSFAVGYFCSIGMCVYFAIALLVTCLPAPFYYQYREKLRLSMLPPKGSPNKAYLDFQIAFDRATPWRMYGDVFFDLFSPKTYIFFAAVIAIGKTVAYFVR